jgi:hypothetical protein
VSYRLADIEREIGLHASKSISEDTSFEVSQVLSVHRGARGGSQINLMVSDMYIYLCESHRQYCSGCRGY